MSKVQISENEILDTHIKLTTGEKVDCFIRRHWAELIPKLAIPVIVAFVSLAVMTFRSMGGFNPTTEQVVVFDWPNLSLFMVFIVSLILAYYMYIEWNDDYLILTNQRVITWHRVLLGRHSQSQIAIEDIQSVAASTTTYLQQWLNYGTIIITSASYGTKLVFKRASDPREMQRRVDARVKAFRQHQTQEDYRSLIEAKIHGQEAPKPVTPSRDLSKPNPPIVRWFVPENPHINQQNGVITWHKHWVYMPIMLLPPLGFLTISFVSLAIMNQLFHFYPIEMILFSLAVVVLFVIWAWYEIEDERNELYILTATQVIEVEKKPLGPEKRNTAGLDKITNVTYRTDLISRIFGYGNVVIETAGEARITFQRLPTPEEVVATVNEYVSRFKKAERERNLQETLTLIRHYHESMQPQGEEAKQANGEKVSMGKRSGSGTS
jgi:uncharacterized membrane protein YdbT with pleckstrin-like domain